MKKKQYEVYAFTENYEIKCIMINLKKQKQGKKIIQLDLNQWRNKNERKKR